jgi:hypothetical protein
LATDTIPAEATSYLAEVVARLRTILGNELVGVYAGGSVALGGYDPARSDLDVAVVCRAALSDARKLELAASLRHEALPCPARGLELVVYPESGVRVATRDAGYELNLNSGRAMPFHLSLAPGDGEEEHWFAIDRAILREHGRVLVGPPPQRLFAPIPRSTLLGLLAESVRWHARHGVARADDAVLNACRALRYAAEGRWSSKQAAGEWGRERLADGALVVDALAARHGSGEGLEGAPVGPFLEAAWRSLEEAARCPRAPHDA